MPPACSKDLNYGRGKIEVVKRADQFFFGHKVSLILKLHVCHESMLRYVRLKGLNMTANNPFLLIIGLFWLLQLKKSRSSHLRWNSRKETISSLENNLALIHTCGITSIAELNPKKTQFSLFSFAKLSEPFSLCIYGCEILYSSKLNTLGITPKQNYPENHI